MHLNTKPLPCIIMLAAGGITCIVGLIGHWELFPFTLTLFIVLVVFYFIGGLIKFALDKAMEYFDEVVIVDDQEDYFEALEREQAMKALLESEDEE